MQQKGKTPSSSYVWAYAAMRAAWLTVLGLIVIGIFNEAAKVNMVIPIVVIFGANLVWQREKIRWKLWIDTRVGLELGAHDVLKELVILKRMRDLMAKSTGVDASAYDEYKRRKPAAWAKAYDIVDNIDYMDSKNRWNET